MTGKYSFRQWQLIGQISSVIDKISSIFAETGEFSCEWMAGFKGLSVSRERYVFGQQHGIGGMILCLRREQTPYGRWQVRRLMG